GLESLDFVTSQLRNTSKELFTLIEKSPKIGKRLHLPFQSGSNRILKLMNRGYSREEYLQLADDYKKIVGGTLSTDVIVGFPSESEEDFRQTKDILEKVRFSHAFIFKYSPRRAAKSFKLVDDVPKDVKAKRHKVLLDLQKKISQGK
ncbi:MAG: radical SAM protein, partial [Candidatus Omnitrophica bacterium]|nr:radical SAM protein [Candidatus Omnitrophota bacterium]